MLVVGHSLSLLRMCCSVQCEKEKTSLLCSYFDSAVGRVISQGFGCGVHRVQTDLFVSAFLLKLLWRFAFLNGIAFCPPIELISVDTSFSSV